MKIIYNICKSVWYLCVYCVRARAYGCVSVCLCVCVCVCVCVFVFLNFLYSLTVFLSHISVLLIVIYPFGLCMSFVISLPDLHCSLNAFFFLFQIQTFRSTECGGEFYTEHLCLFSSFFVGNCVVSLFLGVCVLKSLVLFGVAGRGRGCCLSDF